MTNERERSDNVSMVETGMVVLEILLISLTAAVR